MAIDLMTLAKEADKAYLSVETSFGKLRVYHVPDVAILSVGPDRPDPMLPMVRMKTATGFEDRQAKPGDTEYEQYQQEKIAYDDESFKLQIANNAISALRDIDWSQYDLSKPPPSKAAQEMYNGCWPENELLRKKAWLDWTILFKRTDSDAIAQAISELRGEAEPTEKMVEEVKKSSVLSSKQNQSG
jgi:hypothetical protein